MTRKLQLSLVNGVVYETSIRHYKDNTLSFGFHLLPRASNLQDNQIAIPIWPEDYYVFVEWMPIPSVGIETSQ